MNTEIRRRVPALLTLALVLLLAGGSYWALEVARRSSDSPQVRSPRTEPDYIIDQFRYIAVARDGKAEYVVEGERLLHDPVSDSSLVEQPRLRNYAPERAPMTLRARTARINRDHSEIQLHDDVHLERPQARDGEALSVRSAYMLVLPERDIVKTDRAVSARLGDSVVEGVGMIADNQQRSLALNGPVSATFLQPR